MESSKLIDRQAECSQLGLSTAKSLRKRATDALLIFISFIGAKNILKITGLSFRSMRQVRNASRGSWV